MTPSTVMDTIWKRAVARRVVVEHVARRVAADDRQKRVEQRVEVRNQDRRPGPVEVDVLEPGDLDVVADADGRDVEVMGRR